MTGGWFIITMGVYTLFGGTIFSDKPREFHTLRGFTCFFNPITMGFVLNTCMFVFLDIFWCYYTLKIHPKGSFL
jgi:hypothetical protein